jgi:hypothetical protein
MPQTQRPGAGDYTGRQKTVQAKEQAKAVEERQNQMSMATAVETEEELNGVFDPQSQERLNAPQVIELDEQPPPRFGQSQERVFTGKEPPEQQVAPPPRPVIQRFDVAYTPEVTIRVDQDVENMTYGLTPNGEPNNFTFKEGLAYKVSRDVAEHLNQRGLIRQWM